MPMPRPQVTTCFLLLAASMVCMAQGDRGTLTGTVTDPAGAAVPDATVRVRNPATGLVQETRTGPSGGYDVPYLPVGNYTVTVEKAGFSTQEQTGVTVNVGTTARVDVKLQVGQVQQRVEVTGSAAVVQTDRSDLGQVLNSKEIIDLPLSLGGGLRDNLNFALLTPGTVFNFGNDNSLRIGGGLSAGQSMMLDGAEAESERRNDSSFQSVSTDAISEFRVISNAFSAEYGRLANGVIDFTTKSGTNQPHGSLFEYFRNTDLNARPFFNPTRPVVHENNFGGTFGGPVFIPKLYDGRNKAFFFFSYEKDLTVSGSPSGYSSVPTAAMRSGNFSQYTNASGAVVPIYDPSTTQIVGGSIVRTQFPGNIIPASEISPISQTVLKYVPLPTLAGNFNNINTVGNPGASPYVWSIKGDYNITPNSRLSGLFSQQFSGGPDQIGPIPGPLGNNFQSSGTNKFYRLSHDQVITPTLLNHITFGWNDRNVIEYFSKRYDSIPASDRAIIQLKGAYSQSPTSNIVPPPEYNIGDNYGEYGFWINTLSPSRTANVNEQLSWINGKHNYKFGFEFLRADYARTNCNQCTGEADFSDNTTGVPGSSTTTGASFASFLLGLPSNGGYVLPGTFSFGEPYYAFFAQDDWKVNRKLTINAGLRFELPYPKTEAQSRVSNLCLYCPNPSAGGIPGALLFAGNGPGRTGQPSFLSMRQNAWGPRLGFAYEVVPNLVIRAGGGIFYVPEREGGNADQAEQGFQGIVNVTSPNNGYSPAFTLAGGLPAAPPVPNLDPGQLLFSTVPFAAHYAGYAPVMYDWNFTIEKGIGLNTVLRASYQGTAGVSLLSETELLNQVNPQYLSLGNLLLVPASSAAAQAAGIKLPWAGFDPTRSVAQALRPFPQYTSIQHSVDSDTTGHSTYHAVSITAEHRYSNGLWFSATYTFSKLISNVQGENPSLGTFVGAGDVGTQNGYDRNADKAVSVSDVPHHLVLAYSYDLPVGKGRHFLSNANRFTQSVLGGWRISALQNYQSGYPLYVTSSLTTGLFSGQERANYVGGPVINPAWTGDPNIAPYINPAAFARPAPFTFGNSPKEIPSLRYPALMDEDITLAKDFPLFREGQIIRFQASAFNIANRVEFGGTGGNGGKGIDLNVEDATFGYFNSQANNPRQIQFSLRLQF
jgi:Carboxypeptidase regulatory-like domain